jgi:hypothetical protein
MHESLLKISLKTHNGLYCLLGLEFLSKKDR